MIWNIPKIWEGGECWILGGGPSFPRQFGVPEDVIERVITKQEPVSTYSPYFSVIHDKHVIGVNAAFLLGTWIDVLFFGDRGFYYKNKKTLRDYPNLKVTCNSVLKDDAEEERLKYVYRDGNVRRGISTRTNRISWNGNSGAAAINLAVQFGAKKIYLLGFDMQLGNDGTQHWHSHYSAKAKKGIDPKKLPFRQHILCFPNIAKDAKKLGIEIINVSPTSAITSFKRVKLSDVL